MKYLGYLVLLVIGATVAIAVYVRLAPLDVGAYAALPAVDAPGDTTSENSFAAARQVTTTEEGVLRAVETIAQATPRTVLAEGSVADGRLVFVTRTRIMGYPDVTAVGFVDGMLVIRGQAVYGQSDFGVNRARVTDWLAQLGPLVVAPS